MLIQTNQTLTCPGVAMKKGAVLGPVGLQSRSSRLMDKGLGCSTTKQLTGCCTKPSLGPPMRSLMDSHVTQEKLLKP